MAWVLPVLGKAVAGAVIAKGVDKLMPGEKGTPTTVQNASPEGDMTLRNNSADILNNLLTTPGAIPSYTGPTTAQMGAGETGMLEAINRFVNGTHPNISQARKSIADLSGTGAFTPFAANPSITDPANRLTSDILMGRTMTPEMNDMLRAAINTAQRPLIERFEDDLAGARSTFTRAGQRVQPNSSSPFELAKAKMTGGLASAMGDVASNISFANMAQQMGRQDSLLQTVAAALESGKNRQLTAATAAVPMERGILDSLVETMRVNALPRMIEQSGIDAGITNFNDQRSTFLNLLNQAFAGSQGNPVVVPGSEGTPSFLQSLAPGVAAGAGEAIGGTFADWLSKVLTKKAATV